MNIYENLNLQSINKEANRNYYIPFDNFEEALKAKTRDNSSRMTRLDGDWQFKYVDSVRKLPQSFFETGEMALEETIKVPSAWQFSGYDTHQYVNVSFPISYMPPYVPDDTPCGIYQCKFEIEDLEMLHYLNFEGVDSNLYIWVNHKWVGYDQITHSTKEFNISPFVTLGDNTLTVCVLKWCDGTYFEDQDKFRTSGIIRSVYLLKRPSGHVTNFRIKTKVETQKKQGEIELTFLDDDTLDTIYWLFDESGHLVSNERQIGSQLTINLTECHYWTAETPYLYTLIFQVNNEYVRQLVGIRQITKKNRQIYLNDVSIKLYGVNHHDFDAENGPAMTIESLKKDMLMMKQANMNCIRTAHYPKSPEFYELADQLGFYVISEADIESHGVVNLYGSLANYNLMASDEHFLQAILERVERSVVQNINFSSIIMWSMENESGYGSNFEKAQKMTRQLDSTRLIHNERSIELDETRENDLSDLDVISQMYPPFPTVVDFCEDDTLENPFFMCEYAHAMGNGPGDLKNYFDMIQKYPAFLGGCVWEWADHAIVQDNRFYYGGDFDEELHDGNFCVDGLTTVDRRMTNKLLEYRNIHSPIQLLDYKITKQSVKLKNIQQFVSSEHLRVEFDWQVEGVSVEKVVVEDVFLPKQTKDIHLIAPQHETASLLTLVMKVISKETSHEVATQQLVIKDEVRAICTDIGEESVIVNEISSDIFEITSGKLAMLFDVKRAQFIELEMSGTSLLTEPTTIDIWRAPTDNDRNIRNEWQQAGYHRTKIKNMSYTFNQNESFIQIKGKYALVASGLQPILTFEFSLEVTNKQNVLMSFDVKKSKDYPDLPRFGMTFPLTSQFLNLSYLGYGPYESYSDKHYSSILSRHTLHLNEQEMYLKPQEYGNRYDVKWLELKNEELNFFIHQPSNFSYRPYSIKQLTEKMHNFELQKEGNYLTLDYKHNGIGSNSCGPYLQDEYRFNESHFNWQFEMMFR